MSATMDELKRLRAIEAAAARFLRHVDEQAGRGGPEAEPDPDAAACDEGECKAEAALRKLLHVVAR